MKSRMIAVAIFLACRLQLYAQQADSPYRTMLERCLGRPCSPSMVMGGPWKPVLGGMQNSQPLGRDERPDAGVQVPTADGDLITFEALSALLPSASTQPAKSQEITVTRAIVAVFCGNATAPSPRSIRISYQTCRASLTRQGRSQVIFWRLPRLFAASCGIPKGPSLSSTPQASVKQPTGRLLWALTPGASS